MELDKFGTLGDLQELMTVRDRIDDLIEQQAPGDPNTPRVDLVDMGDAYQLVVEVPGVPQENLEVALRGRSVTVAGARDAYDAEGEEPQELVFRERPSGPFQRTIELPASVDRETSTAHLREGLLILTMPKS